MKWTRVRVALLWGAMVLSMVMTSVASAENLWV